MKKVLKGLTLALVAAAAASPAATAGTVVYSNDFADATRFNEMTAVNADNSTNTSYGVWKNNTYGTKYAYVGLSTYANVTSCDDYLLTPEIEVSAGHTYTMTFRFLGYSSGDASYTIETVVGSGTNAETMTTDYTVMDSFSTTVYGASSMGSQPLVKSTFVCTESGKIRFGFWAHYGSIAVDDLVITDLGTPNTPGDIADLTATAGANNALSATISFTLPTLASNGQEIAGLTGAVVMRGEVEVAAPADAVFTPGATLTYIDNTIEVGGEYTYTVWAVNGDETGAKASTSVYVGPDTPKAVTGLTFTTSGATNTVTWIAPAAGIHGATEMTLTYDVARVIGEKETLVAEGIAETTFSEEFTPEGLQIVAYKVTPINAGVRGAAATTEAKTLGSYNLPFADSFANKTISPDFWTIEKTNGTYVWEPSNSINSPYATPQDGDGGFAYYNAYSASTNYSSRLITQPLSVASSTNPVVEFYVYRHNSGNKNDRIVLQVSCDGGEWVDVATEVIRGSSNKWELCSYALKSYITDATSYRVSFTAISDYGYRIALDNVNIFNALLYDLEATKIEGAANHVSGSGKAEYALTITNKGAYDVTPEDYSIELTCDVEPVEAPAAVAIAAGTSATVTFELPFTAHHAGGAFDIDAKVIYAADEDLTNNEFETKQVAVTTTGKAAPTTITGAINAEGYVLLNWEPVMDLTGYQPVDIHESFEDFTAETEWPYNGFTIFDGDNSEGSTWYNFKSSTFTKFESTNSYAPTASNGKVCLGVTCAGSTTEDDWFISPELNCHASSTMTYSADICSRSSQKSSFEFLYSTTDAAPASFTNVIAQVSLTSYTADGKFKTYKYENIPAEAKYIALHITTNDTSSAGTLIDNINITDAVDPVLGYHIYDEVNGRVNEEMLPADATSYLFKTEGYQAPSTNEPEAVALDATAEPYTYTLTAVYSDGESAKSAVVTPIYSTSGVEDVAAEATFTVTAAAGAIVITDAPAAGVVYTTDGRAVATTAQGTSTVALAPGIYVVRIADKAVKIRL